MVPCLASRRMARLTDLFGQEVVPASLSAPPERVRRPMTSATCGLRGFLSSPSAALQSSLESRLKRQLDGVGSTLVFADLEGQGYACGAAVLPACGVGAPHIRQRLWFVGDTQGRARRLSEWQERREDFEPTRAGKTNELAAAGSDRRQNGWLCGEQLEKESDAVERDAFERSRRSPWADLQWLPCTDGKARPVEPGHEPLAHGVQHRPSKLRAYGNAIVPQVAAEFIKAVMDII